MPIIYQVLWTYLYPRLISILPLVKSWFLHLLGIMDDNTTCSGFLVLGFDEEGCVVHPGHGLVPRGPTVTSRASCPPPLSPNAQKHGSAHQSLLESLQARAGALCMVSLQRVSLSGLLFLVETATSWGRHIK